MEKKEIIAEVIQLQQRLYEIVVPYAIEAWRELNVPLAQLKSLGIIISRGETNFSTLAQDLGVTPGNVTGIIERLEEQGLVSRKPGSEDRRVIRLQATDKGRELLSSLMETQTRHVKQILDYMSMEGLTCLSRGLTESIQALEKYQIELK